MRSIVHHHPTMCEELPLIHTSRCEQLSSIATANALVPRHCDVFQESLTYFFYGRPAYRSAHGHQPGDSIALCPVCFVFRPRSLASHVHRVFPCDSGAVATNRFTPDVSQGDLPELELERSIESARRVVSLLFQSNSAYFVGRVVSGQSFPSGHLTARFYALLQRSGPVGFDDRKSAIEVQTKDTIELKDRLSFVVLPREFLEEPKIRHAIVNDWNCDPVTYSTFAGDAPASYYSVVREKVTERFREGDRI